MQVPEALPNLPGGPQGPARAKAPLCSSGTLRCYLRPQEGQAELGGRGRRGALAVFYAAMTCCCCAGHPSPKLGWQSPALAESWLQPHRHPSPPGCPSLHSSPPAQSTSSPCRVGDALLLLLSRELPRGFPGAARVRPGWRPGASILPQPLPSAAGVQSPWGHPATQEARGEGAAKGFNRC